MNAEFKFLLALVLYLIGAVCIAAVPTIVSTDNQVFEATIYSSEEACLKALEDSELDGKALEDKESQCMDQEYSISPSIPTGL